MRFNEFVMSRNSIEFVIPAEAGIQGFPLKRESRFSLMVPRFRGDKVWTPAFAGVTILATFCETNRFNP